MIHIKLIPFSLKSEFQVTNTYGVKSGIILSKSESKIDEQFQWDIHLERCKRKNELRGIFAITKAKAQSII